jgi:hypothetical protein
VTEYGQHDKGRLRMVEFITGQEPWTTDPSDAPRKQLRKLRAAAREWRLEFGPDHWDAYGVVSSIEQSIRELLEAHPELRHQRGGVATPQQHRLRNE